MSLVRNFFDNDPFVPGYFTTDPYDFFRWPKIPDGSGNDGRDEDSVMTWTPRCDITEHKNQILIQGEFPGVPKEAIHISVDDNTHTLKLEAEMKREVNEDDKDRKWHKQERRYGFFRRAFQLPKGVKSDDIKASVDNGILTVSIPVPKAAVQEGPKRIAIA